MKLILYPILALLLVSACGTAVKYPIDYPSSAAVDDRIIGNWKYEEDTNKNNYYEVTKRGNDFQYHVRFFDRGGTNPTYESNIFFSEIDGVKFLNVPYWKKTNDRTQQGGMKDLGYFFLKIDEVNNDFSRITTYTVSSNELGMLDNRTDVLRFMQKHLNDKSIYTNKAHFYKVK